MLARIKNWFLPFFSLNKSEKNGILFLAVMILVMLVLNMLLPFVVTTNPNTELELFKRDIQAFRKTQHIIQDSIYLENLQNSGLLEMDIALDKIKPIKFDPNKLPDEIWLKMGFTPKQVMSIKKYEARGGKFYQKEDVKKLYCISDAEYQIIEPFIEINSPYQTKPAKRNYKKQNKTPSRLIQTELNNADASLIEKNLGLNPWLANRVVEYRNLLGGYYMTDQLLDVYGMKPEKVSEIAPFVSFDTTLIKKIDINTIAFKKILEHPYINYESTKSIINTRNKIGSFTSLDEIQTITCLSDSAFRKIVPYIMIKPL